MYKLEAMIEANRITHETLQKCKELILLRELITKEEVAILAKCQMTNYGVVSSFRGVNDFQYDICISVNDEIIHGIPDETVIVKGDLVSIDFGVIYEGFCADAAISFVNSDVLQDPISKKRKLVRKTKLALEEAVKSLKGVFPNCKISDVANTIQEVGKGYGIVTSFGGHGIGENLHQHEIFIPNTMEGFVDKNLNIGDFFTIEPMFTLGSSKVIEDERGTLKTEDRSLSAHFEYSIAITQKGVIILK